MIDEFGLPLLSESASSDLMKKFEMAFRDPDFYEKEFLDYYDGPEEKARGYFDHYYQEFKDSMRGIESSQAGITIYRAVRSPSLDKLNLKSVGGSWSYSKEHAHAWYGGEGEKYLIKGLIKPAAIDIWVTLRQNLVNPDEKEFRLNDHAPVILDSILDENGDVIKDLHGAKASAGRVGVIGQYTGESTRLDQTP